MTWFKKRPAPPLVKKSLADPEVWLRAIFGSTPGAAGIDVTPTKAMECTAVRAAIAAIAEPLEQLPVHTYRRGADGSKERDADHPVATLLRDDANDFTPASELRQMLVTDALLHGNGYASILRDNTGSPFAMYRVDPAAVSVEPDAFGGPVYRVAEVSRQPRVVDRADIFHLRAPSRDGLKGVSPMHQAREAIGLALVLEKYAAKLFSNGARPGGLLSFPKEAGELGEGVVKRLTESWKAAHGGENSGGTALLEMGGTFQPMTFTSVDSQFLEMRQFAILEIARAFRTPPIFLQDFGRATWSNSAAQGQQLLTYTLMPWMRRWQGEARLKLFTKEERDTYFAEFLVDDLLRADFAARAEGYAKLISARVLNPNEARAMENRPPYEGGDTFENPHTTATPAPQPANDNQQPERQAA